MVRPRLSAPSSGIATAQKPLTALPIQQKGIAPGTHCLLDPGGSLVRVVRSRHDKLGREEVYIAHPGQDKRMDEWVLRERLQPQSSSPFIEQNVEATDAAVISGTKKRKLNHPTKSAINASTIGDNGHGRPRESQPSSPDREHAVATAVRNVENIRWSTFLLTTWYYSPYPHRQKDVEGASQTSAIAAAASANGTSAKAITPTLQPANKTPAIPAPASTAVLQDRAKLLAEYGYNGRLWVCELCFKYMYTRRTWQHHCPSGGSMGQCTVYKPPGRCVYQRGNYRIWEVDGAKESLYCQNLSLFGKLFIDHKAIHYDMDNFLFYVLCDSSTSRHDAPMAFFSKEKLSADDYNLACIVVFPPFQGKLYGRMLIEFSYRLRRTESGMTPGTPERPISDLGLLGYKAYWTSTILRYLRDTLHALAQAEQGEGGAISIRMSPAQLAREVFLKREDMEMTMRELGLMMEVRNERGGLIGNKERREDEGRSDVLSLHGNGLEAPTRTDAMPSSEQLNTTITTSPSPDSLTVDRELMLEPALTPLDDTALASSTSVSMLDTSLGQATDSAPTPPHANTGTPLDPESTPDQARSKDDPDTTRDVDKQAVYVVHLDRVEALCKRHKVFPTGLLKEECVLLPRAT